jgi:hypothetical protein
MAKMKVAKVAKVAAGVADVQTGTEHLGVFSRIESINPAEPMATGLREPRVLRILSTIVSPTQWVCFVAVAKRCETLGGGENRRQSNCAKLSRLGMRCMLLYKSCPSVLLSPGLLLLLDSLFWSSITTPIRSIPIFQNGRLALLALLRSLHILDPRANRSPAEYQRTVDSLP